MASSFLDLLTKNQPSIRTRQALLVLGLQNDFLAPNARLPVDTKSGFLKRILELVPVFRENAGDIIWVQTIYQQDRVVNNASGEGDTVLIHAGDPLGDSSDDIGDDATAKDIPATSSKARTSRHKHRALELLKKVSARRRPVREPSPVPIEEDETFLSSTAKRPACCNPNTDGVKFQTDVNKCVDTTTDTIIQTSNYSAFNATSLLVNLRAKLVTELYICGSLTNVSVYATALDAARHGLSLNIIDDCLGFRKFARHEEALKQMSEVMGANLVSSDEITTVLIAPPDTPKRAEKSSKADADLKELVENLRIHDDQVASPSDKSRKKASRAALRQTTVNPSLQDQPISTASSSSPTRKSKDGESSTMVKSKIRMRHRSTNQPDDNKNESRAEAEESKPTSAKDKSKLNSFTNAPNPGSSSSTSSSVKVKDMSSKGTPSKLPPVKIAEPHPQSTAKDEASKPPATQASRPKSLASNHVSANAGETSEKTRPSSLSALGTQKPQSLATFPILGPDDVIGEGDSKIMYDFFPQASKRTARSTEPIYEEIFALLYNEVQWQKMFHAQGEVPRLVCAQGEFGTDGSMPVYRHPSDTSMPLLRFSPSVQLVREQVQSLVKHPINHVLIQLYRSGQDYISEHSDKTLDIVRGSSIVNVSFGAQRTMRLRTKKSANAHKDMLESGRTTQRVAMPHNSMFVLGQESNQRWLHSIQPDKRRMEERSTAEKAYSGMRISLTFRHIGTFISNDSLLIWGQGARSKGRARANKVINGNEKETEGIIHAFGTENQSTEFDWPSIYGGGFDVLHFRDAPAESSMLFESRSSIEVTQVTLCLSELGLSYHGYTPPPALDSAERHKVRICYRDKDAHHTEIQDPIAILLYLDRYVQIDHSEQSKPSTSMAYQILPKIAHLQKIHSGWTKPKDVPEALLAILDELDDLNDYHGGGYIAGMHFTIADCAAWPVLNAIIESWPDWDPKRFPRLSAYYRRLWNEKSAIGQLRKTLPKRA